MKSAICSIEKSPPSTDRYAHPLAEELADALQQALPHASTFVRLRDPITGSHHCATRAGAKIGADVPDEFLTWQQALDVDSMLTVSNSPGVNVIAVPIESPAPEADNGFLAACSHELDFPTPRDSAVLKMAAVAAKSALNQLVGADDADQLNDQQAPDLPRLVVQETASRANAPDTTMAKPQHLTALSTFAAGLSHDLGNLLLPIRLRLASIETRMTDNRFGQEFHAIRSCLDSIQRLTHGLELFSLEPNETAPTDEVLLSDWWSDVEPFLRNVLPEGVQLHADFAEDLPKVQIAPHWLAQVLLNLVENAGESLADRGRGRVGIWAKPGDDGDTIIIGVSDDGPGMTAEVCNRCFEPFFTTKTRAISTGLGLSLVHGIVRRAGGTIEVMTQEGNGVTMLLRLPAAPQSPRADGPLRRLGAQQESAWESAGTTAAHTHADAMSGPRHARVTVQDARRSGFITTFLQSLGFTVNSAAGTPGDDTEVWATDDHEEVCRGARTFLNSSHRSIVFLGELSEPVQAERLVAIGNRPDRASLSRALRQCAKQARRASELRKP